MTWGGFDEERVEALDLPFEVVHAGTDAALFAELESAYQRKAPFMLLDLHAALGADQVRGRMGRVPGIRGRLLHAIRPGARIPTPPTIAASRTAGSRRSAGRRRGEVAGRLQARSASFKIDNKTMGELIAKVDLEGAEGRGRGRGLDEGQRGHLEGLDRRLTARPSAGDGGGARSSSPAAASGSCSAPARATLPAGTVRTRRRRPSPRGG